METLQRTVAEKKVGRALDRLPMNRLKTGCGLAGLAIVIFLDMLGVVGHGEAFAWWQQAPVLFAIVGVVSGVGVTHKALKYRAMIAELFAIYENTQRAVATPPDDPLRPHEPRRRPPSVGGLGGCNGPAPTHMRPDPPPAPPY